MQTRLLRIVDGFFAEDTDGVFLGFYLQVASADTWQLYDGEDVIALLENVDRRERAAAGGKVLQPIAGQVRFKRALKIK